MEFEILPIKGEHGFGAVIEGLDVDNITAKCTRDLRKAWLEYGVLVFRGLIETSHAQIKLSSLFGELELHPIPEGLVEGRKELVDISHRPGDADIYEIGGEVRAGHLPWHIDLIYVDHINRGGILRMLEKPLRHGETGFMDRMQQYAALPPALREKIEKLHIVYTFDPDAGHKKFGVPIKTHRLSSHIQRAYSLRGRYGSVLHPIVYDHPETGSRILNVSPWYAESIYEMRGDEGDRLLSELVEFVEDESRWAYFHNWEDDDLVLWDNWRMLHSSYGFPVGGRRSVQRTTIGGDYKLGRIMPGSEREPGLRPINI